MPIFAYGWSLLLTGNWLGPFLLTFEIRLHLVYLWWKIGLVFFIYLRFPPSGNLIRFSLLLTVPPVRLF